MTFTPGNAPSSSAIPACLRYQNDLPDKLKGEYDLGMSILLPVSGVAFAAFCVWLGVRIVNRRERSTTWTLSVIVGLPLLYVGSFGPACRGLAISADEFEKRQSRIIFFPRLQDKLGYIYWPIGRTMLGPGKPSVIQRYGRLWVPRDKWVLIPARWSSQELIGLKGD
jgi:hypothetical protein